jgi:hypothetical protein
MAFKRNVPDESSLPFPYVLIKVPGDSNRKAV